MKKIHNKRPILLRTAVLFIWLLLLGIFLQRELFISTLVPEEQFTLAQAEREEYQGVYFQDKKIGYVINHYLPAEDGSLRVDQKAHMILNVAEMMHQINLHLQADLQSDSTLQRFSFSFESPFYQMSASGDVVDNSINYTMISGSNTIRDSLRVEEPPRIQTARRGYLLTSGMEEGEKRKVPWFDPVSLTAKDSVVEYRGKERLQINGRIHNLHRFIEDFGGARINLWLSDEGDVMKEESPAGFVFVKEPKFKALQLDETSDELLSAVAVKITGDMPDIQNLEFMKYRLSFPADDGFVLDGGRQSYDGEILTVHLEKISQMLPRFDKGCVGGNGSLDSTPYIQSDAAKITALTKTIVAGDDNLFERVKSLADWVYTNLEKRPVLGIPDALTTLDNLRGDCNEHAALFAALARNVGIPARIAAGVVYHQGAFYYHAWNEVCVAGQWLSLDTTTNQFPADLSHIKFIQGEMAEQVRIGSLLGQLTIEPVTENVEKVQ